MLWRRDDLVSRGAARCGIHDDLQAKAERRIVNRCGYLIGVVYSKAPPNRDKNKNARNVHLFLEGRMVRLRIAALLRARGLTAYGLGRGSGITYPTCYRLARESGDFSRLERDTLNRLCQFLKVQPGELIEWVPDAEEGA